MSLSIDSESKNLSSSFSENGDQQDVKRPAYQNQIQDHAIGEDEGKFSLWIFKFQTPSFVCGIVSNVVIQYVFWKVVRHAYHVLFCASWAFYYSCFSHFSLSSML